MALADYLKITLDQVQKMSLLEFKTWLAYFQIRKDEHDKEMRKQNVNKRTNNTRRY
jgi:hypothetical protein